MLALELAFSAQSLLCTQAFNHCVSAYADTRICATCLMLSVAPNVQHNTTVWTCILDRLDQGMVAVFDPEATCPEPVNAPKTSTGSPNTPAGSESSDPDTLIRPQLVPLSLKP